MGKKQRSGAKRQNGLTADKVQDLRKAMRNAAANKEIGPAKVAQALGFQKFEDALESVTVDMAKRDFGSVTNAMKRLTKGGPRGNKYAQHSKAGENAAAIGLGI